MKKIVAVLFFFISTEGLDNKMAFLKKAVIDLLTIGIGGVILSHSITDNRPYSNEDGAVVGSSLLIFGILIRVWRKDYYR